MTTNQIPATQNDAWGFWGTMNEHASAAWPLAIAALPLLVFWILAQKRRRP